MARPRVSVCIPTYSQVEYLRVALDSLQRQKYRDFEAIVTDDSEGDEVSELVAQYDFGGQLSYLRNRPRKGSPANWNAAVERASGEYVKILHHDDWFADDTALGDFVALMDQNPECAFGFSASSVFHPDGTFHRTHRASANQREAISAWPELLYFGNVIGAPSATIYRRDAAINYDERLKWLVDVDFYIRMLRANSRIAYSNRPLICTPTGVAHQVTETSANDPTVDLVEHVLLLEKVYARLKAHRSLVKYWRRLLARHRVWNRAALESYCPIPSTLDPFFGRVFFPSWSLKVRYLLSRLRWIVLHGRRRAESSAAARRSS